MILIECKEIAKIAFYNPQSEKFMTFHGREAWGSILEFERDFRASTFYYFMKEDIEVYIKLYNEKYPNK